ncbi:MAG: hypothetical protein MRZ32_02850 [Bacteroidales bacterium]|nr:hypothetical protein [Bacteroidales bacterium]
MAKEEETVEQYLGRIRQVTALLMLGFDTDFIVEGGFERAMVLAVREFIEAVKAESGGKYPQLIIRYTEDET